MFCINCGEELNKNDKHCPKCAKSPVNKKKNIWSLKNIFLFIVIFFFIYIFILSFIYNDYEDVQEQEEYEFDLLEELNPYIEPLGYFSEPELYDRDDLQLDEWLSYIKYYDIEDANKLLNTASTQFPKQRDIFSSVVKVVCENDDFFTTGSGTNFEKSGFVLTNKHVIEEMNSCVVGFPNPVSGLIEEAYWANPIIDKDDVSGHDLAYLSIESPVFDKEYNIYGYFDKYIDAQFSYFNIEDSCFDRAIQLGDALFIIGYPYLSGGALTITDGLVSSLYSPDGYIITSAKINSGNSGGLAINKNGCYIGVPTATYHEEEGEYLGEIIDAEFVNEFDEAVQDDLEAYLEE